jgi:mono/diheme cytochrome c family protein
VARALGATCALIAVAAAARAAAEPASDPSLRFERDGVQVRAVTLGALRAACPPETVRVEDPYYETRKHFEACALGCALELGFGVPIEQLAREDFLLGALDGYQRPVAGQKLVEPGAYLAVADAEGGADGSAFRPIDRRRLDPGPFYLIWTGAERSDPHRYPWPYQLASIQIASFETTHPHAVPRGAPAGSPARAGFAIFRAECIACHAINGEGGTVGPDLNVPRSIVEYRPAEQIKAFIRDPESFRYTRMPAHPHLSERDLAALIAYFEAMSALKRDPRRAE